MNDFERCLENCTPNMYADDTSVACFAEDMEELYNDLQNELINISDWMRQNKMSLNTKKSEFMTIGHKRQLNRIQNAIHLDIGGEELKRVHEVKYLGSLWMKVFLGLYSTRNSKVNSKADFLLSTN